MIQVRYEETTLINLTTGQSLFLSERNTDFVLDGKPEWGSVTANNNFIEYVNQIGAQKTSTQLDTRPIRVLGWVVGNDIEIVKKRKAFLNKFVNPYQDIRCEYEGYYIEFTPDSSIKYSSDYRENNEVMCKFEIEGTCGVPLFLNIQKTKIIQSPSYPVPIFPMSFPIGKGTILGRTGEGSRRVITNVGDVDAWFTLTMTCLEGTIVNPKLSLVSKTNTFIKVNVTLDEGDSLFISTEYGKEAVIYTTKEGETSDYMTEVTRDSVLFLLKAGENTVTISDDSGLLENVDFVIEFSPMYMEVE